MVKIVMWLVPNKKNEEQKLLSMPKHLDTKLIAQPTAALLLVAREIMNCSDIVAQMLDKIRTRGGKGKCDSKLTAPFNEVLHNIDRIGNSCVNLVEVAEDNAIMQSLLAED